MELGLSLLLAPRRNLYSPLGFVHAGYKQEARKWKNWLIHAAAGNPDQMQIMYGVTGERLLREWTVLVVSGFQNSRPVRVGNQASEQLQLDVYGELSDTLYQTVRSSKRNPFDVRLLIALLRHLQKIWRHPDNGIWEIRGKKQHYTHSKVMALTAFDRMIRNIETDGGIEAPLDKWCQVRQQIHDEVCRLGFDTQLNSFVRWYGSKETGTVSLLLLPIVGFLPHSDPRIVGTVAMIEKRLVRNGFENGVMKVPSRKLLPASPKGHSCRAVCGWRIIIALLVAYWKPGSF